jgi:hypothetical protein
MTKFKVLGGDFDRGEGSLSATHEFYLRKDKKELPAIPPNQVQEVDQATEASLARLGIGRLLPDLEGAPAIDRAQPEGDLVVCFKDGRFVLVRANMRAYNTIYRIAPGHTPPDSGYGGDPDRASDY